MNLFRTHNDKVVQLQAVLRIRIRSDLGFLGHPDPDPGKKFTDPDPDPDPSSTIIFKSQSNGI